MDKKTLRTAQISVAVLLSVIAGFGWMLPAELRKYDILLTTLSLMGTGLGASVIIGDRWRTHWLTGTLLLMLVPVLISLVVTQVVLEHRLTWLGKVADLMGDTLFEVVGYLALVLIVLLILSPYFLLPRYRSAWMGLFVFFPTVALLMILGANDVLYLGYLNFNLLMLVLFASVATGMWWKSGTELDNSEQSIIGQVIKLNESKAALRIHPALILLMIFTGILFGAAWYRRYDHKRDYMYETHKYKGKQEIEQEENIPGFSKIYMGDSNLYVKELTEKEFSEIYNNRNQMYFKGINDFEGMRMNFENGKDTLTHFEDAHDLVIKNLSKDGFDFILDVYTTPSPCKIIKGKAIFSTYNSAEYKDSTGCFMHFDFYNDTLSIWSQECHRAYCGAYAGYDDIYVLQENEPPKNLR